MLKGCDVNGGDGSITNGIKSSDKAMETINSKSANNLAYTWHIPSNRLIEKWPNRDCAKWVADKDCYFFMWADSCQINNGGQSKQQKEEE